MTTVLKTPAKINIFSTSKNPPEVTLTSTPTVHFTLERSPQPTSSHNLLSNLQLVDPWDRFYESSSPSNPNSSYLSSTTTIPLTLPRRDCSKKWIRPAYRKGKNTSGDVITNFHSSTKPSDFEVKFELPKPAPSEEVDIYKPKVPSFFEWLLDKTGLIPYQKQQNTPSTPTPSSS